MITSTLMNCPSDGFSPIIDWNYLAGHFLAQICNEDVKHTPES